MSKIGISHRLNNIRNALETINPRAMAISRMKPAMRMRYELWHGQCAKITADAERDGGPGAAYGAWLSGQIEWPEPPHEIAAVLGVVDPPSLPAGATVEEAGDAWRSYAEADG